MIAKKRVLPTRMRELMKKKKMKVTLIIWQLKDKTWMENNSPGVMRTMMMKMLQILKTLIQLTQRSSSKIVRVNVVKGVSLISEDTRSIRRSWIIKLSSKKMESLRPRVPCNKMIRSSTSNSIINNQPQSMVLSSWSSGRHSKTSMPTQTKLWTYSVLIKVPLLDLT